VKLDRAEYERSFARIVEALEEPVTSSSIVPMYFVCQRARQDVKVALIGQGPDELFAGYKRHLGVRYGDVWRRVPASVRSLVGAAVSTLPRHEALKRGVQSLGTPDRLQRHHEVFSLAPVSTIDGLFQEGLLPAGNGHAEVGYWRELQPQMRHLDELSAFQMLELRSSLPDELLMFGDKLSMAHSLEARVPYLDRTVVEYAQRLGASFMIRGRERKWIHRQVCRHYLPPQILRRKKRGFAVNVVDGWFNSSVEGRLPEMLLDGQSLMYRLLNPDAVRSLLEAHRAGREDNHKLLFSLAMVEQWLRGVSSSSGRLALAPA
jgi:asparagine synthase (glutamine-hydrolysing)